MTVNQHPLPCPMFFTGVAADTKPTTIANNQGGSSVPNGSVFYVTDTAAWYRYSQDCGWVSSTQSMV